MGRGVAESCVWGLTVPLAQEDGDVVAADV